MGIIIRDFFIDWSDPFDTSTIRYWVRFLAGLLPFPFSLFTFCDPVDDVFLNIGFGLRLLWGMIRLLAQRVPPISYFFQIGTIVTLLTVGAIFLINTLIFKGFFGWIGSFITLNFFFRLWVGFVFFIPPACTNSVPVIVLGIWPYHIAGVPIPIPYPQITSRILPDVIPFVAPPLPIPTIHVPIDLPDELVAGWVNTSSHLFSPPLGMIGSTAVLAGLVFVMD